MSYDVGYSLPILSVHFALAAVQEQERPEARQ